MATAPYPGNEYMDPKHQDQQTQQHPRTQQQPPSSTNRKSKREIEKALRSG
eukprot:CAMPEP_0197256210 /NCGR_PEP_ID=MMETSP1429-20130617/74637_1 /TAXON_ID=49237 /ORGANISM="Chaetoceros  sp., Strain UNC1202" /LENGTH=50 /DNA_ID=CAMNT_0042719719 /DNA_START=31 /DNA_END=179 /DNA_ORIENTATION=-